MARWIVIVSGVLGAAGVVIGAFGAHGLEGYLEKQAVAPEEIVKRADQLDVAVQYHMVHVLATLAIGLAHLKGKARHIASVWFYLGIALFSGGLYSMVFFGVMGHWAIVPSGGLCFILGWISSVFIAFNREGATSSI